MLIKNALPAPDHCDNCCSLNIELTTNDKIYGKLYGNWPKIYYCNDCRAIVGCHPGTEIPLGRMADSQTRRLRSHAHFEFDKLWKSGLMPRSKAYGWLALSLGIDVEQCHISWLSKDQLKNVAKLAADYLLINEKILIKRKEKQDKKQDKRNEQRKLYESQQAEQRRVAKEVKRRKARR